MLGTLHERVTSVHDKSEYIDGVSSTESPLDSIRRRIDEHTQHLRYATLQIERHTDRIYGSDPKPPCEETKPQCDELPALLAIFQALDDAEHARCELGQQIARATTLA